MKKSSLKHPISSNTLGERWADRVAEFGGSWLFIFIFMVMIFVWMAFNSWLIWFKPFDPYPYIFLNLVLSCVAAIQAPIIMMSQNRQEKKDRIRAEKDYQINQKAEYEIQCLRNSLKDLYAMQLDHFNKLNEAISELKFDS